MANAQGPGVETSRNPQPLLTAVPVVGSLLAAIWTGNVARDATLQFREPIFQEAQGNPDGSIAFNAVPAVIFADAVRAAVKGMMTMAAILESTTGIDADAPAIHAGAIDHPSTWRIKDFKKPPDCTILRGCMRRPKDFVVSCEQFGGEPFGLTSLKAVIDEIRTAPAAE
jgi:hypothetical protein